MSSATLASSAAQPARPSTLRRAPAAAPQRSTHDASRMLAQGLGGCKSGRRAITAPPSMMPTARASLTLALLSPSGAVVRRVRGARRVAGAADQSKPRRRIPSGRSPSSARRRATSTTAASRRSRRRLHPLAEPHARCRSSALRIALGDWVEIQASYEFLNNDESTQRRQALDNYGGGDARLFTKIYARARAHVDPGHGRALRHQAAQRQRRSDRLGTDETDFFIQWLGSKHFGDCGRVTSISASRCSAIPAFQRRRRRRPGRSLHLHLRDRLADARRPCGRPTGACAA